MDCAYRITDRQGQSVGFIGSSNLSASALTSGVEWNYRLIPGEDERGLAELGTGFEQLFGGPYTEALTLKWVDDYRRRRPPPPTLVAEMVAQEPHEIPVPSPIQAEALLALDATRREGNLAGLVVLATGLGKTFLAAFDSAGIERVLFVAHREEIRTQARNSFRRVRPHARLGFYAGHGEGQFGKETGIGNPPCVESRLLREVHSRFRDGDGGMEALHDWPSSTTMAS